MLELFRNLGLRSLKAVAMFSACWCLAAPVQAQVTAEQCGPIANAYGPWDYRKDRGELLSMVEIPHFPPEVENLVRGKSGYLGGDIDYTLRAFPNHHRALLSIVKWGEKTKSKQPPTLPKPIECYFERALRFRADDVIVRMIYASFLGKSDRAAEASAQLKYAAGMAADNPFTHYNIGLIYFDMKDYDAALHQAHIAYGIGFGQPGLRDQLKAVGKWVEPVAGAAAAAAAASAPQSVPASVPSPPPASPASATSDAASATPR